MAIPTNLDLIKLEKKLSEYQGEDKIVSSEELAQKENQIPLKSFKTSIPSIDRLLNGIEPGELIITTGPTGGGKTTLLMSITQNMANNGINSVWFTMEVPPRQFLNKIQHQGKMPHFYLPSKNTENNIQWLMERIIEAKLKYNTEIVFIDHLHQVFSTEKMKNLSLEIGDVVAQIKKLAMDYGLVIFLIAHNKDREDNKEPQMQDIRDSGMISRLADAVMGVWRVKNGSDITRNRVDDLSENDTWAKVRIWKNRREGKMGSFFMNHQNHFLIEFELEKITDTFTKI